MKQRLFPTRHATGTLGMWARVLCLCALVAPAAWARPGDVPGDVAVETASNEADLRLPPLDRDAVDRADRHRVSLGRVAHFAAPRELDIDPWNRGHWRAEEPPKTRVAHARWTLGVVAEGATSVSLHFDRFGLPEGAELVLRGAGAGTRPLTREDVSAAGGLWTPPILGERVDLELRVPIAHLDRVDLHIDQLQHGYAGFADPSSAQAACRVELACAEADPLDPEGAEKLQTQASSVALLVIEGVRFCTGFLVTDVPHTGKPWLLTASHCGLNARDAESLVVLWNYRRDGCRNAMPAPAVNFQLGATLRVSNPQKDVALLELAREPDPAWNLTWAGWDRSDDPLGAAFTIHHPDAAPLSIARANGATRSRHFATEDDPAGDHLRVDTWYEGTTEGGSSGAPLFDAEGRVRGWLRGGHAACDNRLPDWFGRLADVWDDARGPRYRLRDWLDPTGTEMVAVDSWAPPIDVD